ncbi:MAG: outer membrane lipoprotein-sorting protein [Deltaproteobacteria bacterium]|nr:outer membrane lipoprotein-sorting protein [Deltaproteobacteria bacterium]
MGRCCKIAVLLTTVFFFTSLALGQNSTTSELPPRVLPLPNPGVGEVQGLLIHKENAPYYKDLIIPELYHLIRFQSAVVDAARSLRYEWKADSDWLQNTQELFDKSIKLSEQGTYPFSTEAEVGAPFGNASLIEKQWEDYSALSEQGRSNSDFPLRLLWNLKSQFWSQGLIDLDFTLQWLANGKAWRDVRGKFQRVYPWIIDPTSKLPQIFREKIQLTEPAALRDLIWLTYRFQHKDEDVVWVYSPAIKKVRQLTGSNRADSLFTSSVSSEDFLTWSGKTSYVRATVLSRKLALVPFESAEMRDLSLGVDSCYRVDGSVTDTLHWNFATRKFKSSASWLPTNSIFVPRYLYEIELVNKDDPYSLYGRQILYVEEESFLPVYKIVYDRAGRHWKTIISAYGLAATKDRRKKVPFPAYSIVLDKIEKKEFVLDYNQVRYCNGYTNELGIDSFNPNKLP